MKSSFLGVFKFCVSPASLSPVAVAGLRSWGGPRGSTGDCAWTRRPLCVAACPPSSQVVQLGENEDLGSQNICAPYICITHRIRVNLNCPPDWIERCLGNQQSTLLGVSVRVSPETSTTWDPKLRGQTCPECGCHYPIGWGQSRKRWKLASSSANWMLLAWCIFCCCPCPWTWGTDFFSSSVWTHISSSPGSSQGSSLRLGLHSCSEALGLSSHWFLRLSSWSTAIVGLCRLWSRSQSNKPPSYVNTQDLLCVHT